MERLKTDLAILYNFGHAQEGHGASLKSDGTYVVESTNVITGHKCNKGHKCNNIWSQM